MNEGKNNSNLLPVPEEKLQEALELLQEMEKIDKQRGYERIMQSVRKHSKRTVLWKRWAACAAILLPLAIAGGWGIIQLHQKEQKLEVAEITPGANTARLIVDGDKEVLLDTLPAGNVCVSAGMQVKKESEGVVYVSSQSENLNLTPALHELIVPRGGEYKIVLADGTKVWLNADSKLRYPSFFAGNERCVHLEGEAYFEVAKDSLKPFRVETRRQNIQVLGTSFNVCAYPDEKMNYTSLATGSVEIHEKLTTQKQKLVPGEQIVLNTETGETAIHKIDVQKEIAWKDGLFVFDNQTLEQIMAKITRWYNVNVYFRNSELKQLVFKGNLPRYSDFSAVLNVLSKSSRVEFSVNGRTVTVR